MNCYETFPSLNNTLTVNLHNHETNSIQYIGFDQHACTEDSTYRHNNIVFMNKLLFVHMHASNTACSLHMRHVFDNPLLFFYNSKIIDSIFMPMHSAHYSLF